MMRRNIIILYLFLLASCDETGTFSSKEKKTVTDSVQATLTNYYQDIRQNGLKAEFNYLDSSDDFFWVPPGYSSALSYTAIRDIISKNALILSEVNNEFEYLQIIPISKKSAVYTARIHSSTTDTSGKQSSFRLLETGVMIKKKGGWKLCGGQTSLLNN